LKAFLLPFGAPVAFPPRIRQRPFGIAAPGTGVRSVEAVKILSKLADP